ncbi:MAG TPA: hypothetical protein VE967_12865, partial [Gemmatimonadaceae bacterium]|nr:hypothetical protein [Gemmatimonadaceae bacterium]
MHQRTAVGLLTLLATTGHAQRVIPIRQVVTDARTQAPFFAVSGVRELRDGRLLVNDRGSKRLLVLDRTFTQQTITADSTGHPAPFPANRGSPFVAFSGDSTLITDDASTSFVVLDPQGRPARAMAIPVTAHYNVIASPNSSGIDARGRLLYQEAMRLRIGPRRGDEPVQDSLAILRANFETRTFDTVARIRIQSQPPSSLTTDPTGRITGSSMTLNPLGAAIDAWTVTSDGRIAIVRGHDYHIDWIDGDGSRRSTPKLPFDWRRLTDDDKQKKIDSAKGIVDAERARGGYKLRSCPVGESDAAGAGGTGRGGGRDTNGMRPGADPRCVLLDIDVKFAALAEMGDYIPPIRANAVLADRDGNVWIVPTTSLQARGGLLY